MWCHLPTYDTNSDVSYSLNGIGAGPSEILQPAVIADIFFLHDRGTWNALYWVVYMGSLMIAPIIAGPMAERVGWQNFWWLNVAVTSLSIILGVFGFPETKWTRAGIVEAEVFVGGRGDVATENGKATHPQKDVEKSTNSPDQSQLEAVLDPQLGKGSPSKQQWMLFQANASPLRSMMIDLWTPWRLFTYPIVLFASFVVSWSCSNFLILNLTQSQVFAAPPYNMSSQSIGVYVTDLFVPSTNLM
jgi:MFS family permease